MSLDLKKIKAVRREKYRLKEKNAPRGGTLAGQIERTRANRNYLKKP